MSEQLFETMRVVALPTRTNFRGVTTREVALFRGAAGWSEFSPFLEYSPQECLPWLESAIEAASTLPPQQLRSSIKVNATLPAINEESEIERILGRFPGCKTVKVKVGANIVEDIARLKKVRTIDPAIKIRIDVNGGWTVKDAVQNIHAITDAIGGLEYVEQPVETIEELKKLKVALKGEVRIAGDEILRKAADPFAVNLNEAVDIVMLKVAPLGGITRTLKLAAHHKLPVVVSSALESAIGITTGLQLAAALPILEFDCGLATGSLLSSDVALHQINDGGIQVESFEPNFDGLLVSPERHKWWQDRVMKTWELIA